MVKARGWLAPVLLLCVFFVSIDNTANAELYVAGQLGPQISNNFGKVGTNAAGVRFSDLDLKNSIAFGVKAGYFFPQLPNLGLEVSASHAKPDIKDQSTVVTGPVPAIGS